MLKERRKDNSPAYLQFTKEMRLVSLIGAGYLMVVAAGAIALVLMVWWSLMHDMDNIAVVIGYAGTFFAVTDRALSHLMPSPLSTPTQRRQSDTPAGTDADPVSITVPQGEPLPVTETAPAGEPTPTSITSSGKSEPGSEM